MNMDAKDLDKRYRFKMQNHRLVYLGQQGQWHQFALESEPDVVWSEVTDATLEQFIEECAPS